MHSLHQELLARAAYHFSWNYERIARCLAPLSEADIWRRPNSHSNAIGNQLLHLCGNITQYIISSLGQTPDLRERDAEFAATDGLTKTELLARLEQVTHAALTVIEHTPESELLRVRPVQAFEYSGTAIVLHATEHYSYHTGQIIFWTKQLLDRDMNMYGGVDLNARG